MFTGVDLAMEENLQFSGLVSGTGYTHSPFSNFERAINDPKFIHSLENPGSDFLKLIEVQTGSYLGEDDIVRLEDKYGRV